MKILTGKRSEKEREKEGSRVKGLKWRRVKKEENLNQKEGNFANLVNREHILQVSIKNYHQKARKRNVRSILCLTRTFQRE